MGTCWEDDTWEADTWGDDTWGDAVVRAMGRIVAALRITYISNVT